MGDDDDRQVGRILTRREALGLLGAAGIILLPRCSSDDGETESGSGTTASVPGDGTSSSAPATSASSSPNPVAAPNCIVKPALTEGPFFVDERLDRSDIRTDPSTGRAKEGTPLTLAFLCAQLSGSSCTALPGATVDVWHCDAEGRYSDVRQNNTAGQKFLRGFQSTDASGRASFTTIYPGWYMGRAVHIHFKIRTGNREFTSQLFFDDSLNDEVYAQPPYASRGPSPLRNARDGIYGSTGGQLLLKPTKQGQGYAATFEIGLQV
jgi:protocatechuate 3,4-dioxygenase beta subunit